MEKLEQVRRQIVVVFFAAVFLLGMFLAKDYGMPWDETTEFGIFAANIKEYARVLEGEDSTFVRWADEKDYPYISEYIEKDHGSPPIIRVRPGLSNTVTRMTCAL